MAGSLEMHKETLHQETHWERSKSIFRRKLILRGQPQPSLRTLWFVFTVEVADDVAVGTIADQPITIFGPDFFETTPRLVSDETDFSGVPSPVRTLTFSIARPGGFSSANNGTYLVVVNGSTIFDAAGNPVNGGPIGELELRI